MSTLQAVQISRSTILEVKGIDEGLLYAKHYAERRQQKVPQTIPTRFFPLGGVGEIGKNTYVIEHDDEIIIIDAGIKFLDKKKYPGMTGVVSPIKYLQDNIEKVKALIITHGHEDHIGGISYWLTQIQIPRIICPVIASELIKKKMNERKVQGNLELYADKSTFLTKHFLIDFFRVNHSVPDSFGVSVLTPNGLIVSSGDFRFDFCSLGDKFDLQKASEVSKRGVDLLLCESTNSEQPGFNESEKVVIREIANIIFSSKNRVFITSFASNLGRIEEIIKVAIMAKRKIVSLGRSIDSSIAASQTAGYLKTSDKIFISGREIHNYSDGEILILCTGSQGEENASLSTIVRGCHPFIEMKPTDSVIFSSNIIPGNTLGVEEVINKLYKTGARVYLNSEKHKIHSSGHASKLEQQLFVNLINPMHIIPIHGENRMIRALKKNCMEIGIHEKNITIIPNGGVVHLLNRKVIKTKEMIDTNPLYIDDGELTSQLNIIQERIDVGAKGVLFFQIFLDIQTQKIISTSQISSSGTFYLVESLDILKALAHKVNNECRNLLNNDNLRESTVEKFIAAEVLAQTQQSPIVKVLINRSSLSEFNNQAIKAK